MCSSLFSSLRWLQQQTCSHWGSGACCSRLHKTLLHSGIFLTEFRNGHVLSSPAQCDLEEEARMQDATDSALVQDLTFGQIFKVQKWPAKPLLQSQLVLSPVPRQTPLPLQCCGQYAWSHGPLRGLRVHCAIWDSPGTHDS